MSHEMVRKRDRDDSGTAIRLRQHIKKKESDMTIRKTLERVIVQTLFMGVGIVFLIEANQNVTNRVEFMLAGVVLLGLSSLTGGAK